MASPFSAPATVVLLDAATERLLASGIDSARLDAEIMLGHVSGWSRARVLARPEEVPAPEIAADFEAMLERRCRREPLAYIVGGREFWSLWFEVDRTTLVPRPETEILVERALAALDGVERPSILDAGTGSGCIAVALAAERQDARITAIDASAGALRVAQANAERHGVTDRVRFLELDLLAEPPPSTFDLVVSNPPYVRSDEIRSLAPEISIWEPEAALDGGPDGLSFIRHLLGRSPRFLRPQGTLLVEIGNAQADAVLRLAREAGFTTTRVHTDYAGMPRVLEARGAATKDTSG